MYLSPFSFRGPGWRTGRISRRIRARPPGEFQFIPVTQGPILLRVHEVAVRVKLDQLAGLPFRRLADQHNRNRFSRRHRQFARDDGADCVPAMEIARARMKHAAAERVLRRRSRGAATINGRSAVWSIRMTGNHRDSNCQNETDLQTHPMHAIHFGSKVYQGPPESSKSRRAAPPRGNLSGPRATAASDGQSDAPAVPDPARCSPAGSRPRAVSASTRRWKSARFLP